jgi:hypothetical protein
MPVSICSAGSAPTAQLLGDCTERIGQRRNLLVVEMVEEQPPDVLHMGRRDLRHGPPSRWCDPGDADPAVAGVTAQFHELEASTKFGWLTRRARYT